MKSQVQPYTRIAGYKSTKLVKGMIQKSVKMNKTLINYVYRLTQDDLLLIRLPEDIKAKIDEI